MADQFGDFIIEREEQVLDAVKGVKPDEVGRGDIICAENIVDVKTEIVCVCVLFGFLCVLFLFVFVVVFCVCLCRFLFLFVFVCFCV